MMYFKKSLIGGVLLHSFQFLFTLLCGYALSDLLERATAGTTAELSAALWGIFALFAVGLPLIYLLRRYIAPLRRTERQKWREVLYGKMLRRQIEVNNLGELETQFTENADTVASFYQDSIPAAIEGLGMMVGCGALLCSAHIGLGLLLFTLSLSQLLPTVVYEKWAKRKYESTLDALEDYDSRLAQGRAGITTLKAYGRERWFADKLHEATEGSVQAERGIQQTYAVENIVFRLVDNLLRYGSYLIIGVFVAYGQISITDTPILVVLTGYLYDGVKSVFDGVEKGFAFQVASKHLKELPEIQCITTCQHLLEVKHISKSYGTNAVLQDISCTVEAGEKILLCGENGCGKSTLLQIILGLLPADSGTVALGTERIGFALQEEAALPLTGAELLNDLTEHRSVDREQAETHLKNFRITDELMKKPLTEWSMGEKKKFYLSAAFARPCDLLILDEPTNHLDTEAQEYLFQLMNETPRALLVTAHTGAIPIAWVRVIPLKGGNSDEG